MTSVWELTSWFAIQCKQHRERLASVSLGKLDLEVFLPWVRHEAVLFGEERPMLRPLFRGYLFARFCPIISVEAVRAARGVLRVLGNGDGPLPIPVEIIEEIRGREQSDGFIRLEAQPMRAGQPVMIGSGPFEGMMGKIERELDDGKRVAILLDAINRARLLVEKRHLTPA